VSAPAVVERHRQQARVRIRRAALDLVAIVLLAPVVEGEAESRTGEIAAADRVYIPVALDIAAHEARAELGEAVGRRRADPALGQEQRIRRFREDRRRRDELPVRQLAKTDVVIELAGVAAFEFRDAGVEAEIFDGPVHAVSAAGIRALAVEVAVCPFFVVPSRIAEVGGVVADAAGADLVVSLVAFLKRAVLAGPVAGIDFLRPNGRRKCDRAESE
jgi:hypothetical protein